MPTCCTCTSTTRPLLCHASCYPCASAELTSHSSTCLSTPSAPPRSRTLQSGAAMDATTKLHGRCCSPASALLVPQSSVTSSSPTRAAPSAPFPWSKPPPELVTVVAVSRTLGCTRGQAVTGHRGASRDYQWVRGDPRVPPRHFPDADVPSSSWKRRAPGLLCAPSPNS
jgi:hypothetical protein